MTILERLIHRGYHDEASDRGDDLPGGGVDETTGDEGGKDTSTEDDKGADAGDKTDASEGSNADAEGGDKGGKKNGIMIPKSRFDEAVTKARREAEAAQRKVEELEAQVRSQSGQANIAEIEKQIDEMEDKLDKARADNDPEEIKRVRAEIRKLNGQLIDIAAEARARQATALAVEQVKYGALVEQMEKEHPELNPDSDEYDQEVVDEVTELKEAYEAKGMGSTEALRKALKYVYKAAPEKKDPPKKDETDEGGTAEEKLAKAKAAETEAQRRKAEAIEKARKAAAAQAKPPVKGAGKDSDLGGKTGTGSDVAKMKDEDFEKLSKEEKARLRGDIL